MFVHINLTLLSRENQDFMECRECQEIKVIG